MKKTLSEVAKNKTMLNFWIDAISLINLLLLMATGSVLKYVLPHGSRACSREKSLLLANMTRHEWGDIHFLLALLFSVLMIWHIVRHWDWIKSVIHK